MRRGFGACVRSRVSWRDAVDDAVASKLWRHHSGPQIGAMMMAAIARHHGFSLVLEREPELVPCWPLAVTCRHCVDLLQRGISELQHIHHADNLSCIIHHR